MKYYNHIKIIYSCTIHPYTHYMHTQKPHNMESKHKNKLWVMQLQKKIIIPKTYLLNFINTNTNKHKKGGFIKKPGFKPKGT